MPNMGPGKCWLIFSYPREKDQIRRLDHPWRRLDQGGQMKFRAMGLEMAKRGFVSMAIDYRLAEEALFPANIHDCHAAVRFLRAHAGKYKVDPERIGVVGGSAGAHLAGLLATTAKVKTLHGKGGHEDFSSEVQAAVVMSGPMEISTGSVAERSLTAKNFSQCHLPVWRDGQRKPGLLQVSRRPSSYR